MTDDVRLFIHDEVSVDVDASSLDVVAVVVVGGSILVPLLYMVGPIRFCIASRLNCIAANVSSKFDGDEGDEGNKMTRGIQSNFANTSISTSFDEFINSL